MVFDGQPAVNDQSERGGLNPAHRKHAAHFRVTCAGRHGTGPGHVVAKHLVTHTAGQCTLVERPELAVVADVRQGFFDGGQRDVVNQDTVHRQLIPDPDQNILDKQLPLVIRVSGMHDT